MNIRFLGAHNLESKDTRLACLLIDDVLAIDAGGLISSLTFQEQLNIKAILVTHHHYDHIKDIPILGVIFHVNNSVLNIYSIHPVYEALEYIFKYPARLYSNFLEKPPGNPTIKFTNIESLKPFVIGDYKILAVPMKHSVPSVGYQITSPEGKSIFYTGDTGIGLQDCWQYISPDLIVIEVTGANEFTDTAREVKHLTPTLLKDEMTSFKNIKGYLPQIVTVHMFPQSPEKEQINA
ncbi:MAG: MBL fold metallo-hydrolase, partial [Dehalococcoidales bacterium]|nr:MBL fold metallo-hydrolase [Dehalococcoidales bacterium]